ncbi:hypothetical protein [Tsukamurella ocularis]|uniref:hypothetical protein n=1 Tax=Tsukamurella ocularis TaxID=1970234 RepID=UPI00216A9243|nr:hypothetical protein [Tsukamurella ocularis]MCS3779099.1 hypothetical protein [Tsukamurella ocularis]MCS3787281.1 hypothetical protein [Tsukamurella ocularis]MCS3851782.1 hypothetical protein [Tsukamurella ocularis]
MTAFQHFATPVTAVATATVCGLLLAGCGNSSDPVPAPSGTPTATATAAQTRAEMCGQTRGPDGALYVHALGTVKVDCAEAMRVANAFGPQIAQAKPVTVEAWNCTFPQTPGMLARCDSGDKAIGFFSSH